MTGAAGGIAVIIAAYGAEETIGRAVQSALAQPEVSELCVVDDRSRDGTAAAARAAGGSDGRLSVLTLDANSGPSAARNRAMAETRAAWIAILDADDYLLPGRMGALLAQSGGADIVADTLLRQREGAEAPVDWARSSGGAETISFSDFVAGNMGVVGRPLDLGFVKPILKRSFLDAHGLRYRTEMRLGEDYELYARALALGAEMKLIGPAGYVSVEREGSLSKAHSEADLRRLRDCDYDLIKLRTFTDAERALLRRHRESVNCRLQWRLLINAVKARDLGAAAATFESPRVALYLAARLGEQAWLRGAGRGPHR